MDAAKEVAGSAAPTCQTWVVATKIVYLYHKKK